MRTRRLLRLARARTRALGRSLVLCAALLAIGACTHARVKGVESGREHEVQLRTRFVPPFAYEAYVRGELALLANEPERAVLQFELASAAPDEDAFLLSRLAAAQAQAGDVDSAERTLAEAERVNACEEQIWLTRGSWAERKGDGHAAAAAYQRAYACAPESPKAQLALYRALQREGREAEALALLARAASTSHGRGSVAALLQAIVEDDVAEARFALDSWLASEGVDASDLNMILQRVVERSEPTLALSFKGLRLSTLTPALRARLAELSSDRELLRALLAQHGDEALGGAEQAARLALLAGDLERAELYAGVALSRAPTRAARSLKIRALIGLGDHEGALQELRAVDDPTLQRELAREQLLRLGMPALARELSARDRARLRPAVQ